MSKIRKTLLAGFIALTLFTVLNISQERMEQSALAVNNDRMAPQFEVDPYWPQPLPNKWLLGRTIGIAIDERDHLFVVHRDQDSMFILSYTLIKFKCACKCSGFISTTLT